MSASSTPFPPSDFSAFLLLFAAIGAVVIGGEVLYRRAGWAADSSRRFVHLGTGLLIVMSPYLFREPGFLYLLAIVFVVANGISAARGYIPSMHATRRRSWGTATFPLALIAALFITWSLNPERIFSLQIAFLVLAVSDPLAAWVGNYASRPGRFVISGAEKSTAGTAAFALSAVILAAGGLLILQGLEQLEWHLPLILIAAIATGVIAAAVELLGTRGWDNFFIVISIVLLLTFLHEQPEAAVPTALALLAAAAFGLASWRARFLDLSGAIAGGLFAFTLLAAGGWAWAVPAIAFFLLSSILSRLGESRKHVHYAEKGSRRDAGQVYANGGTGWILLLMFVLLPEEMLYWAFLGSFAAATADTWATEIGTFFKGKTRSILTGRAVSPGTSGGVSFPGTLGALSGALTIWLSAYWVAPDAVTALGPVRSLLLVVGAGLSGALVDSLAGAGLQAQYEDKLGFLTERRATNGKVNPLARGWPWLDNDRVNILCTLTGAGVPMVYLMLR